MKSKGTKKNNLSVIIIAKNEEKKIEDCIKSVLWADEIVLVDNGSEDATCEIARKYKASIYRLTEGGYSDLRNLGLKKAKGDWILYIDADERATEDLKNEVQNIIANSGLRIVNSLYVIPRLNIVFGKELKHGGWWPDYVKRLYKKKYLKKWIGNLHEEPVFKREMGYLKNHLIHIKHSNLEEMVEKTNTWSEVEAKLMFDSGHPKMNIFRFLSAIGREFYLRMIKKRAFMDGGEGIIYALYQVWSKFISYAKLWEMQNTQLITHNS